ncbi:P-loop NTPase [Alienimonas chondri]|uniref:Iron-sulfur cluster carrier protein n=1 Tax=Alienimonas chondri TaxID=2681879 RepID=A0ABX1VE22_9PLAN|nr:P-loop NTPase [Alienimonas chondri]NNJ25538.1 Iron-sulfur cluster carrier protein [Alienimonas chondri]
MSLPSDPAAAVRAVVDPAFGRSLGELNAVGEVAVDGDAATVTLHPPCVLHPLREHIEEKVVAALGGGEVTIEWKPRVIGRNAGGRLGLTAKNIIAVGSGKGGVGKSTVAAGLAIAFAEAGAKVGLVDADIHGPSLPHLFGVSKNGPPEMTERRGPDGKTVPRLVPVPVSLPGGQSLGLMSAAFVIPERTAAVLRGPMTQKYVLSFLQQAEWGELDYLVIDLPPGTGDVALTLAQNAALGGAVVVCTPQKVALLDAVKAVSMYRQLEIPVLGMVENMSGDLFGRGGARTEAESLGVPTLGEIPADGKVRELGDAGTFAGVLSEGGSAADPLRVAAGKTALELARGALEKARTPTLEVL